MGDPAGLGSSAELYFQADGVLWTSGDVERARRVAAELASRLESVDPQSILRSLLDHGATATTNDESVLGNTATSAFLGKPTTCAGLVAACLIISEIQGAGLRAVLLPDHVLLGASAPSTQSYETLRDGSEVGPRPSTNYPAMDLATWVDGPTFVTPYIDNLAARAAASHDGDSALALFRLALPDAERFPRVYYNLGTYCLAEGDTKCAVTNLRRAIALGIDSPAAREALERALAGREPRDRAAPAATHHRSR